MRAVGCRAATARPRGRPRRVALGAVQCGAAREIFAIWTGRTEPAGREMIHRRQTPLVNSTATHAAGAGQASAHT
jgi:hypothetical protein